MLQSSVKERCWSNRVRSVEFKIMRSQDICPVRSVFLQAGEKTASGVLPEFWQGLQGNYWEDGIRLFILVHSGRLRCNMLKITEFREQFRLDITHGKKKCLPIKQWNVKLRKNALEDYAETWNNIYGLALLWEGGWTRDLLRSPSIWITL